MQTALAHPSRVDGLMLVATAARFNIPKDRISAMRDVMMGRAPQPFTTDAYSPRTIKENFDLVREGWMEQIRTDPRVRYTDMVACTRCDLREQIARIDKPALILAGADDPITKPADAEFIHGRIRGSKLRVIANAAHHLPNEQPAEANAAIEGFLSEL